MKNDGDLGTGADFIGELFSREGVYVGDLRRGYGLFEKMAAYEACRACYDDLHCGLVLMLRWMAG